MKFIDIAHQLLRIPYIVALAKLKFISRWLWNIDVWPRHSYLTEAFIPTQSDLDISCFSENTDSIKKFVKFYKFYSFLYPFMGELNVYTPDTLSFLNNRELNGFEIERDPILIKKYNIKVNEIHFKSEKAAAFLLMAFLSDYKNLITKPHRRIKKWRHHFQKVNQKLSSGANLQLELIENDIVFSILTAICNLSGCRSQDEAVNLRTKIRLWVDFILNNYESPNFDNWLKGLPEDELTFLVVYFPEFFCSLNLKTRQLSKSESALLTAHINWTLHKMLRQCYTPALVQHHIIRLNELNTVLSQKEENLSVLNSTLSIHKALDILKNNF